MHERLWNVPLGKFFEKSFVFLDFLEMWQLAASATPRQYEWDVHFILQVIWGYFSEEKTVENAPCPPESMFRKKERPEFWFAKLGVIKAIDSWK